jgi:hypothetical protein
LKKPPEYITGASFLDLLHCVILENAFVIACTVILEKKTSIDEFTRIDHGSLFSP